MRRVALIYNPVSGQYSARRKAAIEQTLAVLREAGVEVEALETKQAGEATIHARQAMDDGCDAVLACGGDGTVHEILQSLVGSDVALGVIPLGTANALAANLGLIGAPGPRRESGLALLRGGCGNRSRCAGDVAHGRGAEATTGLCALPDRVLPHMGYVFVSLL
jgi:hypothetical protein